MTTHQDTTEENVETDVISYEDFAKLDIRIGTITQVDVVPDADKLLRLQVDFGSEQRQIVSGIREFVEEPNTLVGMQAPFVFNLATRTIRGLESQGMMVAAGDNDTFAFLHPDRQLPAGTAVH